MRKSNKKVFGIISAIILSVLFYYFNFENSTINLFEDNGLKVCFVDCGQGDCSITVLPDNKIMMIDAGENGNEDKIISILKNNGITKIDYLIATHPHSDHIGGMSEIISQFDIGNFYAPKVTHTSKTFEDMIKSLNDKKLVINSAKSGKIIFNENGVKAEFLAPIKDKYDNLNNYSAVVKLQYKGKSVLFCGDAETPVEEEILKSGFDMKSDIVKIAHHGSSSSTSEKFLNKANCKYAVISCGKDNDYGHPHKETVDRLKKHNCEIYNTSLNGCCLFIINDDISVKTSK